MSSHSADMQSAPDEREAVRPIATCQRGLFETWAMETKHPVFCFIGDDWLDHGGDPNTYANDYIQGAWVMWQYLCPSWQRAQSAQGGAVPVAWRMWNGKTWRFCYSELHGKRGWEPLYAQPPLAGQVGVIEALKQLRATMACHDQTPDEVNALALADAALSASPEGK